LTKSKFVLKNLFFGFEINASILSFEQSSNAEIAVEC
jgi:hypothetical protein